MFLCAPCRYICMFDIFFRRGLVYRGIYLPSLTGKLQDDRLEFAYLRYAHRQRQKSLFLVNVADIVLKLLIIFRVYCIFGINSDTTDMDNFSYTNCSSNLRDV